MELVIRELTDADRPEVLALINTDHLSAEGIMERGSRYWGGFDGGRLVGLIGCEYEQNCGLLRSALVDRAYRKLGVARRLTDVLLRDARKKRRRGHLPLQHRCRRLLDEARLRARARRGACGQAAGLPAGPALRRAGLAAHGRGVQAGAAGFEGGRRSGVRKIDNSRRLGHDA